MSQNPAIEGILPALITPFTADGAEVDHESLARIASDLVAAGVGGLVPCGSTGEFPTLTGDERRELDVGATAINNRFAYHDANAEVTAA